MNYGKGITEIKNESEENTSKRKIDTFKNVMYFVFYFILFIYISGLYKYIPKSKFAVLHKVKEAVAGENYELVSREYIDDEYPRTIKYVFQSTERNLEFDAYSTYTVRRNASLNFPGDDRLMSVVLVDYDTAVRNYYQNGVMELVKASPYVDDYQIDKSWEERYSIYYIFDIDNYNQLQEVISTICQVSKLYEEEQNYHDTEWIKENPLCSLEIAIASLEEDGTKMRKMISEIDITGLEDEKTIVDRINNDYISKMKDGEIPWDPTIPGDAEGD